MYHFFSREILNFIIQHPDVNLDARNWEGMTPLFLSLLLKVDDDIIKILIDNNCDVNIPNNEDVTPLHLAVQRSMSTIGDLLIRKGADIEATDFDGYTPILDAIRLNSVENIYMLLYYNADVNMELTNVKVTAIEMAVMLLDDELLLDILVNYISDYDKITHRNETLLFTALSLGKRVALKLLENGADPCFSKNSISCLGIIASKWNANLFESVWSKLDLYELLETNPSFLGEYLFHHSFNKKGFIKCLYNILESPIAESLCESIYLNLIFDSLTWYSIEKEERLEIIYLFLSVGLHVTDLDLLSTFSNFGYNDEFEIFMKLNVDRDTHLVPDYIYPPIFSLVVNINLNYEIILSKNVPNYIEQRDIDKLIEIGKYFNVKSYLTIYEHIEQVANFRKKLHNVNSLKEMTRNRIRKLLATNYVETKPFNYYNMLKHLHLPQIYIDIITLRRPIYFYE